MSRTLVPSALSVSLALGCGGSGGSGSQDDAADARPDAGSGDAAEWEAGSDADAASGDARGDADEVDAHEAGADGDAADVADAADSPDAADAADAEEPIPPGTPPTDLVAMFVGTGASGINFGALYPGAAMPFGMVKLSPDTGPRFGTGPGTLHAGGYYWGDTHAFGFSHVHVAGTGVADQGNLLVAPARGDAAALATGPRYRFPLDHGVESARPGYYALDVADVGVRAELTATPRVGLHRYTFEPGETAHLLIDLSAAIGTGTVRDMQATIDPGTGIVRGSLHPVGEFSDRFDGFDLYFVAVPSVVPDSVGAVSSAGFVPGGANVAGERAGAVLSWNAEESVTVVLRVAISFVDLAGAERNLELEAERLGFDEQVRAADGAWNDLLGRVEVEGGRASDTRLLFTSLYHAMLMPTLLTDGNTWYRGIDNQNHQVAGFTYFTDFSLWDTYRTFHPLMAILYPEYQREFLRSLLAMGEQRGTVPRWPLATGESGSMVGTSADIVFGDSIDKGLVDFDVARAWELLRQSAFGGVPAGGTGRGGYEECVATGWCPADRMGSSVSLTLEYAIDDACLAIVADAAGAGEDAATLRERSNSWRNLWDAERGFLAPRNADGSFPPFTPSSATDHYVEGTGWQYTFMVQHDGPGLVETFGRELFVERLSTFFERTTESFLIGVPGPYYWHGNEPDIHSAFLFAYADRPELARRWARWVADAHYSLEPDGLAGNDDGGTLSSWYVFAASGLFPMPCTGEYVLTAPFFDRVTWHLPGGDLDITADSGSGAPIRVEGEVRERALATHGELVDGADLVLPAEPPAVGTD